MQFGLSESQLILRNNARKFFAAECPPAEVRRIMESSNPHDGALWDKMAEQGFTGVTCSEQFGGLGLGKVELALLLEEMGRALVPGAFFSTVVCCAHILEEAATLDQKRKYLTRICDGELQASFATHDAPGASVTASEGLITGEKLFVADAAAAGVFVVETANAMYVVPAGERLGITIKPMPAMDLTRKLYAVQFDATPAERLPGPYATALDVATLGLAAEMVGGMHRVLDLTVEYAKARKQFGKPIGQFQAVQHQCADMFLWLESARSAVYYAAYALQESVADASVAVSVAKMYASDAAREVCNRGIQIHGGMGFTWENELHLHYRRFKSSETAFGDATYHRERIARMVIDQEKLATAN